MWKSKNIYNLIMKIELVNIMISIALDHFWPNESIFVHFLRDQTSYPWPCGSFWKG